MRQLKQYLSRTFLAFSSVLLVGSGLLLVTSSTVSAAPERISIVTEEGNTVNCFFELASGNIQEWAWSHPPAQSVLDTLYPTNISGWERTGLLEDYANDDTSPLYRVALDMSAGSNQIWAYLVGESDVNDYHCMQYGVMIQSPDNPTTFVGAYINFESDPGSAMYREGSYNPTTKAMRINNGSNGALGASREIYNSNDPVASHVSFTTGTGGGGGGGTVSTGPCAGYPAGPVLWACLNLSFRDFNHITWREELYRQHSWDGNTMRYHLIDSYDPARKEANTYKPDCTPYFEFSTGTDNGQLDIDIDGDAGDSGEIEDFVEEMNSLPTTFRGGRYVDYDLNCNEVSHDYFEDSDGTPDYDNVANLRNMLVYSAANNRIAFERNLNPGGNEEVLGRLIFNRSADNPNLFTSQKVYEDCADTEGFATITVEGDMATMSEFTWRNAVMKIPTNECSNFMTDFNVRVRGAIASADTAVDENAPTPAPGTGDGGSEEAAPEPEPTCSSEGGALGWILCPVLAVLDETTQFLESEIRDFLFINPAQFSTDRDSENQLYAAWSTFRSIATVIIVIIALMMIFSQAMGAGVFDNYSVKKLLPRLLIAGIGIQLSWFLLVQLINISNILGDGIGGLLGSPFGIGPTDNLRDHLGGITSEGSGGDFFTGLVAVGAVGFAVVGAIVPLAIGVVAALFVGLLTLVLRNMIVLLGVVLAPVAIAMSVLPGTQKTSKWWWESFEKALLMYPIVIALLMSGKIVATLLFATATPQNDAGIDMIPLIAGIIAWYAPFFLLPKALQAGGSALGKLTGLAGDKSKGWFDRARGWDDNRKKRIKEVKTQDALNRGGIRGGIANFKAGNVGGARRHTRQAFKLDRDKNRADAIGKEAELGAASAYRERTGRSLALDQAEVNVLQTQMKERLFDKQQAELDIQSQEKKTAIARAVLGLQNQNGARTIEMPDGSTINFPNGFNFNSAGDMAEIARQSGHKATIDAAVEQIVKTGSTEQFRTLYNERNTPNYNPLTKTSLEQATLDPGFYGQFKDSAPDLAKGSAFQGFKNGLTAEGIINAKEDTIKTAQAHYKEAHEAFDKQARGIALSASEGALVADYGTRANLDKAINTTVASVKTAATNDNLRGSFKAPQATAALSMLNDLAGAGVAIDPTAKADIDANIDSVTGIK